MVIWVFQWVSDMVFRQDFARTNRNREVLGIFQCGFDWSSQRDGCGCLAGSPARSGHRNGSLYAVSFNRRPLSPLKLLLISLNFTACVRDVCSSVMMSDDGGFSESVCPVFIPEKEINFV
ncbi:hypothetical protein P3S68_016747 [Capsicum galapagoense]